MKMIKDRVEIVHCFSGSFSYPCKQTTYIFVYLCMLQINSIYSQFYDYQYYFYYNIILFQYYYYSKYYLMFLRAT